MYSSFIYVLRPLVFERPNSPPWPSWCFMVTFLPSVTTGTGNTPDGVITDREIENTNRKNEINFIDSVSLGNNRQGN